MALVTKNELIVLALFIVLGFAWIGIVTPYLQDSLWFRGLDPVSAYLLYNIGSYFLIAGLFSVPLGVLLKRSFEVDWFALIVSGLMAFILFSNIYDMWAAPLAWDTAGHLLMNPGSSSLANTSVDYLYGWIFLELGGPASFVYWFTYLVVPILTMVLFILVYGQREVIMFASRLFK